MANSGRKLTTLPDVEEVERQGSTGSVNFSRPISAQGHSPTGGPSPSKSGGSWFSGPTGTLADRSAPRPATSEGVRAQNTSNVQQSVSSAANKPTKKKQFAVNSQGNHLARANSQSISNNEDLAPIMVYDPASRTFITKARPVDRIPEPPSPAYSKPQVPKPGEYDPNTRTIVPALPPQQPSIVVTGGDNPARRTKPTLPAVNTQMEPPPRNPARDDFSLSPVSPRAAGVLQKQPSIVREDPEGEMEAEGTGKSYTRRPNGYSKSPVRPATIAVTPAGSSNRSESLDVPRSGSDSSGRGRGSSNSPSRSAHFSATPILPNTRHDPPERGISPVKSAMKHSPSSSIRTGSPMAFATSPVRKAMSETSETPSLESSAGKKKKSVRVSFTEQPEEIEAPITPSSRSPGYREVSPIVDDDMDEIMKPRPALPSFGSVRPTRLQQEVAEKVTERPPDRREVSSDHAIGAVLANSTPEKNDEQDKKHSNDPEPPEVTSRDGPTYSSDESEDESTPATELDAGDASAKAVSSLVIGPPPQLATKEEKSVEEEEHVPEISLQPPTPGEEEKQLEQATRAESPPPRSSLEKFSVPGGWTAEPDEEDVPVAAPATVAAVKVDTEEKPQPVQSKPFVAPLATQDPFIQESEDEPTVPQLSDIAESDSDDSAIFSDAAEDLSDLEDGGFASLDAIVESPVAKPKKKDPIPESPSARHAEKRTSKEEARPVPTDWSHATSYWKQLSKKQREQIERSHFSSDDEYVQTASALANRPKKKSALKKTTSVDRVETVMNPPQPKPAPVQNPKPAMRKSMRGPPEPAPAPLNGVQMRSSLREGGGSGMRSSMRDRPQSEYIASKPAQRQNARPQSASGSSMPTAAAGGAMSRNAQSPELVSQDGPFPRLQPSTENISASAKLAKKLPPPAIPADDSDSESSFKKKRRPSQSNADASGRYSMRRSMRAMSMDSELQRPISPNPTPKERKAFSVRSLSPSGSFFGRKQLKESMRAPPAENNAKTLRGPNSMRNTASKPSGKAASGPRPKSSATGMASKFRSRFADSDDEDDREQGQKSSFFRSRFADSDDDEPASRTVIPADLTPVRGIPRRRGQEDGDSTDLSDEDDEDPRKASRRRTKQSKPIVPDSADVEKAMAAARRNLGMTNGSAAPNPNEGSALSKGSLRKPEPEQHRPATIEPMPKKRGFMGSILRRRTNSNTSQRPALSPPPPLPNMNTGPASPRTGKLQRRTSAHDQDYFNNSNPKTKSTPDDANWPLATPTRPSDLRPSTSDGLSRHEQAVKLARSMRPDIGRSYSNSEGIDGGAGGGAVHVGFADDVKEEDGRGSGGVYSAKTGKKKKFGMLRKAFGLND